MSRERRQRQLQRRIEDQIQQAQARGDLKPGTVFMVNVRHDGYCALLKGTGPCNCNPEVCAPERVPAPDEN